MEASTSLTEHTVDANLVGDLVRLGQSSFENLGTLTHARFRAATRAKNLGGFGSLQGQCCDPMKARGQGNSM